MFSEVSGICTAPISSQYASGPLSGVAFKEAKEAWTAILIICPIQCTSPTFAVKAYSCFRVTGCTEASFLYSNSIVVFVEALSLVIVKIAGVIL